MVIFALLRLAGVVGRRGHHHRVRKAIAIPFLPLVLAAVAGAAGDKLVFALGFLSDANNSCALSLKTKILSLMLIIIYSLLINA